jgi:ABC-type uncharacterized transport system fused permease/ATPase subunit
MYTITGTVAAILFLVILLIACTWLMWVIGKALIALKDKIWKDLL